MSTVVEEAPTVENSKAIFCQQEHLVGQKVAIVLTEVVKLHLLSSKVSVTSVKDRYRLNTQDSTNVLRFVEGDQTVRVVLDI